MFYLLLDEDDDNKKHTHIRPNKLMFHDPELDKGM